MIDIVSNMKMVASVNSDTNAQSKSTSDNDFKEVLNKQSKIHNKKNKVNKPTKEIKTNKSQKIKKAQQLIKGKKEELSTDELNIVEDAIVKQVTETLGISKDELKEILSELDMTVFDLLLPDKLDAFLTKLYNVENTFDLLSNQDIINNIRQLKTQLSDVMESFKLDNETIKDIINKVHNQSQSLTEDLSQEQLATNNDLEKDTDQKKTPTVEITDERTSEKTEKQTQTGEKTNETGKVLDQKTEEKTNEKTNEATNEKIDGTSKDILAKSDNISEGHVDFNNELNVVEQNVQKVEIINNDGTKEIISYNINTEEVIEQIVSNVKVELNDDKSTMMIQLRPEHLGKLSFSLTSENGVITANFMAENPAVKELIEANLAQLRVSLQEQGIDVDKLEVNVADNNMFNQDNNGNNFANQSDKKKRAARMINLAINSDEEIDSIKESDDSMLESNESGGIDYSV
ncbi:MAG: flagellar hook-length control protein FliK [Vallitalea sp.]|jgi:flagellar hook-length control protein FliK|nr:flagellar hook-length control protein FliK [Vallitalea sp.]